MPYVGEGTSAPAAVLSCDELPRVAAQIRRDILEISYQSRSGHIGSAFSCADLLTALYFAYLRVFPAKPHHPERDRFILSKGHACAALYACLFRRGFFTRDFLDGFGLDAGTLRHHPDRDLRLGIEASTGSLGHGLPLATGLAFAAQLDRKAWRSIVLLSDGELNEGTNWEALQFAAHHRLARLTVIVDCNEIQALGNTRDIVHIEDLAGAFESLGWAVSEIDGHDFAAILAALHGAEDLRGRPMAILANTVKGKGVSFMERELLWHYRCPDAAEYARALEELSDA